jgi:hypothetical protein
MIAVVVTVVGGSMVGTMSDEILVNGIEAIPIAPIVARRNRKRRTPIR